MKNCIKKSLAVLSVVAAIMMAGCASSGDKQGGYNEWRQERAFAENIEKAYAAKRAVTLADVTYKSELKNPALAASVNSLSATIAAMYLTVVKGADDIASYDNGRTVRRDLESKISQDILAANATYKDANGATRDTPEFIDAINKAAASENRSEEDKIDLAYYWKVENEQDPQQILDTVVLPLIKKLGEESVKVAQLAMTLKNDPEFKKLAGFEAMKEGKAIVSDADALSKQVADASAGLVRWKEQLELRMLAKQKVQTEKSSNR